MSDAPRPWSVPDDSSLTFLIWLPFEFPLSRLDVLAAFFRCHIFRCRTISLSFFFASPSRLHVSFSLVLKNLASSELPNTISVVAVATEIGISEFFLL
jgi:hypothetical protein